MRNYQTGITLMELMITVAIVAVLAAVVYPSYTQSVLRSHRTDARAALMQDAQTLEKCYTMNGKYTSTTTYTDCITTLPHPTENGFYTISIAKDTQTGDTEANSFVLTAAASGSQIKDSCGNFTLNSRNQKTPSLTTSSCWAH